MRQVADIHGEITTKGAARPRPFTGSSGDLRAMKRALSNAPLGPKAVLALTTAIIALEADLDPVRRPTAPL